jgi:hypothetical protein
MTSIIRRKGFGVLRRRMKTTITDKLRVCERSTGQTGIVIKAGVQVSEVKWDDGSTQFCVNEWLDEERNVK